tara:strand:+ start:13404 stop:14087 length:684 start_codon:yes stop_codon:yes gene_type:complete
MRTKIYYDGVNISKYINQVEGVTTNTSYVASAGITDYNLFIEKSLDVVNGKPISFQVTSPNLDEIQKQALFISQKADNIYVKIPIILPNGQSSNKVISDLVDKGVKVNVTCIHTPEQALSACESTEGSIPSIISLFAGGVSDSGNSPQEMFKLTSDKTKDDPLKEILYAGCQRVYSLIEAQNLNADIITVPDAVMDKLGRMEINELDTSIKKSELFFKDGKKINLKY